jgi:hypothetical protein
MPVMLKWAFWLTKIAHSIGNSITALLLDAIGIMIDRIIIGWLLKWTYSVQKAVLVPLLAPLFAVDY